MIREIVKFYKIRITKNIKLSRFIFLFNGTRKLLLMQRKFEFISFFLTILKTRKEKEIKF